MELVVAKNDVGMYKNRRSLHRKPSVPVTSMVKQRRDRNSRKYAGLVGKFILEIKKLLVFRLIA